MQNVTGGFDVGAPVTAEVARGYAWVGLTTQKIGVEGTPNVVPGLADWDPKRYRGLDHPGDAWSYDVFTQLGRALKGDAEVRRQMLGGFAPDTLLATGASQSAMRLSTYINAVHMHERVFDGFLLTVHWGICPPLDEVPLMDTLRPDGDNLSAYHAQIRDDLNVPILVLATECEARYNFATRQPDTDAFRFWEVAGASHQTPASVALLRAIMKRDAIDVEWPVAERTNTVDWDYIQSAALRCLARWSRTGSRSTRAAANRHAGQCAGRFRAGWSRQCHGRHSGARAGSADRHAPGRTRGHDESGVAGGHRRAFRRGEAERTLSGWAQRTMAARRGPARCARCGARRG